MATQEVKVRSWGVIAVFLGLGGAYWWTQNQSEPTGLEVPIFDFEKQSLEEVVIHQPGQRSSHGGKMECGSLYKQIMRAATTMVNQTKASVASDLKSAKYCGTQSS